MNITGPAQGLYKETLSFRDGSVCLDGRPDQRNEAPAWYGHVQEKTCAMFLSF